MVIPDAQARWTKQRRVRTRWSFSTGEGRTVCILDEPTFRRAASHQQEDPFLIGRQRGRQWWWYRNSFYRDDAGLLASDVKALALAREG